MLRFLKGFFGLVFMLPVIAYMTVIIIMTINNQPIDGAGVGTISVGIMGTFGFIMFRSAIINEDIF